MTDFQRKLHHFVGKRAVMAVAREVGVDPSTLQRWLGGRSPTIRALKGLAEGSGVPVAYWADEDVPELPAEELERGTAPIGVARVRLGPTAQIEPDAADPRAILMPDDSMAPVIERAQAVVYDAAAVAEGPGLVVVRVDGRLTVRRRVAMGEGWVYLAADASVPATIPKGDAVKVHPVVAVVMRSRRADSPALDGYCREDTLNVAEDDPPYGK